MDCSLLPAARTGRLARRTLTGLALFTALGLAGCAAQQRRAEPAPTEPTLTAEQRERYVESFDVVWQTIHDRHFDPEFGGVDWDAVRDELRPQVVQAETASEARRVLSAAIARLELTHFGIIPRNVYDALEEGRGQEDEGSVGLTVRVYDNTALVTDVRPDLPADRAGIRPGWVLEAVGDTALAPILTRINENYTDSTLRQYYLSAAIAGRISGPPGEDVTLTFRDGDDDTVTHTLTRVEPEGVYAKLGNLPPMLVRFDSRRLPENVGYITFTAFFDPTDVMAKFEQAVREYMDADGIIIDLRGNPGGIGGMAMGMANWFIADTSEPLGTLKTRDMELRFAIFPRAQRYDGPVAVLVDGCTASTSEILAGGLQDTDRARIFGTRSAGAALPSVVVMLPSGDGFQYAMADYFTTTGHRLEGNGVVPDEEVVPTRAALLAGRDPVLEAAVAWIRSQD
jgi:carboxyl-terminal processing protease